MSIGSITMAREPPLPIPASVSASTSPASNIKIERVLNSSSASSKPFLQAASVQNLLHPSNPASTPATTTTTAAAPRHLPASFSASAGANTAATPAIASVQSLLHPDSASSPIQHHQHQHLHQQQLQSQRQLKQEHQEQLAPRQQLRLSDNLPSSSESSMATAVVPPQPAHVMQPFTRPIRFVANDGQPHAKRRRISAAYVTPDTPFSRTVKVKNNIPHSFPPIFLFPLIYCPQAAIPFVGSSDLMLYLYISSCATMYPFILLEFHDVYICWFSALPYEDSSLPYFPWFS